MGTGGGVLEGAAPAVWLDGACWACNAPMATKPRIKQTHRTFVEVPCLALNLLVWFIEESPCESSPFSVNLP